MALRSKTFTKPNGSEEPAEQGRAKVKLLRPAEVAA